MNTSFYSESELARKGFKRIGNNCLISRNANFYGNENMEIGNNVRIDDFCILSGNIKLGNCIHISAYSALYGKFGITMHDYTGLSPRCTIFSATDDFSGEYLIGPMVEQRFTNIVGGEVILERHVQIGAGSIILPNVIIKQGTVTGAMTLVNKSLNEWGVYIGIPAKFSKSRKKIFHL